MVIGSLIGKVAQLAKRKIQIRKAAKRHSKTKKRVKKELSKAQKTKGSKNKKLETLIEEAEWKDSPSKKKLQDMFR